jgi:hypothetical protein
MSQRVRPEVAGPMTGSVKSGSGLKNLGVDPGFRWRFIRAATSAKLGRESRRESALGWIGPSP